MAIPFALIFLFSIAFFIGGIYLLKRGLWPALVGNDPHCKACGYLLVGIASDRCPECGGTLTAENIVHGVRQRRGGLTATGIIWILLGILPFVEIVWSQWNSIEWIHFEPASFLVRNVKASFDRPAWQELKRRGANGSLSDAQIQALVEIALQQQSATARCPIAEELVVFAGDQLLAGKMTTAQKDRFCQQSLQFSLLVRPKVAQGVLVPYTLTERSGCPNGSWWINESIRAIKLDGKVIEDLSSVGGGGGSESGLGASGTQSSAIKCSTIGKHELVLVARMMLYHGPFGQAANSTLIHQEDRESPANFEMVAASADQIQLITDQSVVPQLRVALHPEAVEYQSDGQRLLTRIGILARPYDIAFNVIGRWNGSEHRLGSISVDAATSTDYSVSATVTDPPPASIDIILRTSEKVAHGTPDQTAVWNGELIYSNLQVKTIAK